MAIWELKHSVIADARPETVWEFFSNFENVSRIEEDAVEIRLDGPYQAGTKGTTTMPGQDPVHWRLVEVQPPVRSVTEVQLAGATVLFTWTFEELVDDRTRLTQHIALDGAGAKAYVSIMEEHFASNIAQGMKKIAEEIEKYESGR